MDLTDYVAALRGALTAAAAAGGEQSRETARLLADALEPAVRLVLIDALSAMADEVTATLDGPVVDIRVRGSNPEIVVTPMAVPASPVGEERGEDDGPAARISLRLPDALKTGAEKAAATAGLSMNAWLVRAVADALGGSGPVPPSGRGPRRFSGFARS